MSDTDAALRRAQEVTEDVLKDHAATQRRERLAHQLLDAASVPSIAGLRENAKSPRFRRLLVQLLDECSSETTPLDLEHGLILRLVSLVLIERLHRS